jgi:hypothetical protein
MAMGSGMPPLINLTRSSQSAVYTMTAGWQAVFTDSCSQPYIFVGGVIDLSTMAAADNIEVRIRKKLTASGAFTVHDDMVYADAQPASRQVIDISMITDVYGVEISMRQPAGVLRSIPCEFNVAKRIGL